MVQSTWGTWFVEEEVEAVDPEAMSLWYLGCNGFIVRSAEATIYIDPYFGNGEPPWTIRMIPVPLDPADATECDAVLITHEHIDHMHPPSFEPLVADLRADLYAPEASYREAEDELRGVPEDRKTTVQPGEMFEIGDILVHVRPGDDPDAKEPVSYVLEHESGTYFNSGDGRPGPAFQDIGREFDIDVGSLTFGTVGRIRQDGVVRPRRWYSDENGIVESANALGLDRLVPVHWDMWKGVRGNPALIHEHAASFPYPRTIDVPELGDRIDVDRPGIVPLRALVDCESGEPGADDDSQ